LYLREGVVCIFARQQALIKLYLDLVRFFSLATSKLCNQPRNQEQDRQVAA
jgi:hypothetical protein